MQTMRIINIQTMRIIANALYIIALLLSGVSLVVMLALKADVYLVVIAIIAIFLGALGALLNFHSPSYKSEKELDELKTEYDAEIRRLYAIRMKHIRIMEDNFE
jgi:hypothetical protein